MRCSGGSPCEACILYHEDCSYTEKHDGRKPASKAFVSALEQRVKDLEAILVANGLDTEVIPVVARPVAAAVEEQEEVGTVGIEQLKVRGLFSFTRSSC